MASTTAMCSAIRCTNKLTAGEYPYGHFGIVFNNTNPDMQSEAIRVDAATIIDGTKFGGIFVIGRGHTIQGNRLSAAKSGSLQRIAREIRLHLQRRGAGDAADRDLSGQARPSVRISRGKNKITGNVITGFKMAERCIAAAPGVDLKSNTIKENICRNQ